MAASELFRAAHTLLAACSDGDGRECIQFVTVSDSSHRQALFALLPDCVKRVCGTWDHGDHSSRQIGVIWPAHVGSDGTVQFLFASADLFKSDNKAPMSALASVRSESVRCQISPLAFHSALILLHLFDSEIDPVVRINEHDSDEVVSRKIVWFDLLYDTTRKPLKSYRELAARCVFDSFRDMRGVAFSRHSSDEHAEEVTSSIANTAAMDVSVFRNRATGQRAALCVGRPLHSFVRAGEELLPVFGLDPRPEPNHDFITRFQWPFHNGDDELAGAVREFAIKLISYNPLVSAVALAQERSSGQLVIGIGVISMEWEPDTDGPLPDLPPPLGNLYYFPHVILFNVIRYPGAAVPLLPPTPANVSRTIGSLNSTPIAADVSCYFTGGITLRDGDRQPVLVTVGHGFRLGIKTDTLYPEGTAVCSYPANYRLWVQRDMWLHDHGSTSEKSMIEDLVASMGSLSVGWSNIVRKRVHQGHDVDLHVQTMYNADDAPSIAETQHIGVLRGGELNARKERYCFEYAVVRLADEVPAEVPEVQRATHVWDCASALHEDTLFQVHGATSGHLRDIRLVPSDVTTHPIHYNTPIFKANPVYTGLLVFRSPHNQGLVGGDSGACYYYIDGERTIAVAIHGQSDTHGQYRYAYPLHPIMQHAKLTLE